MVMLTGWNGFVTQSKKIVLTACVLVLVVLGYFAIFGLRTTRIETIRRKVNDRSSIGDSPDDVIRFLDSEHLAHSTLMRPEVMYMNGQHYDGVLLVWAGKKGTWRSMLQREDIEMIFVFDENRKLVRTDVFPEYTGL